MAREEVTVEVSGSGGLEPTDTNLIADGHKFRAKKGVQLRLNNGATGLNLTLQTPRTIDGLAVAEKVIAIGSNEEHIINFRDVDLVTFTQSDGMIYIDYSDVADGDIAVWE